MRELQNQINRQYSEFTERLDRHEREISIIKNRVPQNAGNAAPPAHPQTPQQFLTDANAVVANHNAGFYGPELQAHFQIKYFNRPDPAGLDMAGRVRETEDTNAFFCGVVIGGQLLLIPNHRNQNVMGACVNEFFAYPNGHNQNTIHRIDSCAVLTFDHNSGYWFTQTKGRIN